MSYIEMKCFPCVTRAMYLVANVDTGLGAQYGLRCSITEAANKNIPNPIKRHGKLFYTGLHLGHHLKKLGGAAVEANR